MTATLFIEVLLLVAALLFGLPAVLWQMAARFRLGAFALEAVEASEDR